jgi:hypothetical protein
MFFRTHTDKYNLEIIIAVTDNAEEVSLTPSNNWQSTDQPVVAGNYWFNGQVIKPGDHPAYDPIAAIIEAYHAKETADFVAAVQAAMAAREAERERIGALQEDPNPFRSTPATIEEKQRIGNFSQKPIHHSYLGDVELAGNDGLTGVTQVSDISSNPENLLKFQKRLTHMTTLKSALVNATLDNGVITFNPPFTYSTSEGGESVCSQSPLPHGTIAEYETHIQTVIDDLNAVIAKIQHDLSQ